MTKTEKELKKEFSAYVKTAIKNTQKQYLIKKGKIRDNEIAMDDEGIDEILQKQTEDLFDKMDLNVDMVLSDEINVNSFLDQINDPVLYVSLCSLKELQQKVLMLRIVYVKSFDDIGGILNMTAKQAENSYQKDLNAHQSDQMTFFHSKNIVEAKFLFSLFHNETVHIEKNDQRKNTRYRCTDPQKRTHHSFPFHTGNIHHITERTLDVKKCRHDRGRQKIRKIDIPVFPDISPGHFQIEAFIHDCFLLL